MQGAFLLGFTAMITGCAEYPVVPPPGRMTEADIQTRMDMWIGVSEGDLIMQRGAPDKTLDDGKGGKIHVYITRFVSTAPSNASAFTYGNVGFLSDSGGTAVQPTSQALFQIGKDGLIYGARCIGTNGFYSVPDAPRLPR